MSNKLGFFLAGGAIGAVAALLYAPRTGEETRAIVAEKANAAWGDAQNVGANAGSSVQQAYQAASVRGQEVVSNVSARVQEAASNIKPSFTQNSDELREKIEAARQRIANQVAKNAEEDSAAAAEEPVETEVVTEEPAAEEAEPVAEEAAEEEAEKADAE